MYLLLTDETNTKPSPDAKFFAYGGLIVPFDKVPALHRAIEAARKEAGYKPEHVFKFDTRSRPTHVTADAATTAKAAVLKACAEQGVKFIANVVLHQIAKSTSTEELIRRGANTVIGKFNYFLARNNSWGLVVVDRLPQAEEYRFLSDKFTAGLVMPDEKHVILDRVKLFASTCANASHLSSAMDIVLGTFRYCINEPKNVPAAKQMMADVTRLIWADRDGDKIYALELGLVFRPKTVNVESYKAEYDALLQHINELIADQEC